MVTRAGRLKKSAKLFAQKNFKSILKDTEVADYIASITVIKGFLIIFYSLLFGSIYGFLWSFFYGVLFPKSEILANELLIASGMLVIFMLVIYLVYNEKLPVSKVRPKSVISAKHIEVACFVAVLIGFLYLGGSDIKYIIYSINIIIIYIMIIYLTVYLVLLGEINVSALGISLIAAVSIYMTMRGVSVFGI